MGYSEKRDGSFDVRIPAPLWFTDPLFNFDTLLDPLWRLFRYRRDSEGYEALDLLFGLYSWRSTPQGETRWDILGGLVGGSSGGARGDTTRLLWFLEF